MTTLNATVLSSPPALAIGASSELQPVSWYVDTKVINGLPDIRLFVTDNSKGTIFEYEREAFSLTEQWTTATDTSTDLVDFVPTKLNRWEKENRDRILLLAREFGGRVLDQEERARLEIATVRVDLWEENLDPHFMDDLDEFEKKVAELEARVGRIVGE